MHYIALGNEGVGDLGTVLLVLNLIALAVFVVTISIDNIMRGIDRILDALHKVHWLHRPR